jgi:hypothetical protein
VKKRIPNIVQKTAIVGSTVTAFIVLSLYAYGFGVEYTEGVQEMYLRIETLESLVNCQSQKVAMLEKGNSELVDAIASTRTSLEKTTIESKAEQQNVLKTVTESIAQSKRSFDLPAIISKWSPFLARVECVFESAEKNVDYLGSGFLEVSKTYPFAHVLTNRHVVNLDRKVKPQSCAISLPGIKEKAQVSSNAIFIVNEKSTTTDVAFIDVGNRVTDIDSRAKGSLRNACTSEPRSGDRVVVLGYPSIGVKNDITATEGIISGAEDDYYVTSAKVDAGNSGGVAILIKENGDSCYLGMPTFVEAGRAESLGRILKASRIVE